MAAPKATTKPQSTAIDRQINDLSLRGHTLTDIAAAVGVTKQAVAARLKKLNAQARLDREAHLAHEVRTLNLVQQHSLEAWDHDPAPAHMTNLLRASESRRKLLGLDAPARQEHSGPDGAPIAFIEVVKPDGAT
jgi:citrate synthase